jgi:hypothetical protein
VRRTGKAIDLAPKANHSTYRVRLGQSPPNQYQAHRAKTDAVDMGNSQKNKRAHYLTSRMSATGFGLPTGLNSPLKGQTASFTSLLRSPSRFLNIKPTDSEKLKVEFNKELIKEYRKKHLKVSISQKSLQNRPTDSSTPKVGEKITPKEVKLPLKGTSNSRRQPVLAGNFASRLLNTDQSGQLPAREHSRAVHHSKTSSLTLKTPVNRNSIVQVPLFQALASRLDKEKKKSEAGEQRLQSKVSENRRHLQPCEADSQKKALLEEKLNLSDIPEAARAKAMENVMTTLAYCSDCIKKAFTAFESSQKELLLKTLKDAHDHLVVCLMPQRVILETFRWILEVLFQFGEYQWCIEFSDRFLMVAFEMKEFKFSLRYHELIGHCYREIMNHKKSLAAFYRMLFAALYLRDSSKEMSAYASISREYYELGDVTTASYYYHKFNNGVYEPEKTLVRKEFLHMEQKFIKDVVAIRVKKPLKVPQSPSVSFYESFSLQDHEVLNQKIEQKRGNLIHNFDNLRAEAQKLKGFHYSAEDLGNPLLHRRYNQRAAMETVKIGDVGFPKDSSEMEYFARFQPSELRLNFLNLSKINFTNNTDSFLYSHNSGNRSSHAFRRVPDFGLNNEEEDPISLSSKTVTSLKDDIAIMNLLELFNRIGLVVESAISAAEEYQGNYCR